MEMLIAVAVIVIIALIAVVNYNSSNKLGELKYALETIANNLRQGQTMAFSGSKVVIDPLENNYPYELGLLYKFTIMPPLPPAIEPSKIGFRQVLGNYGSFSQSVQTEENYVYPLPDIIIGEKFNVYKIEIIKADGSIMIYNTFEPVPLDYHLVFNYPDAQIYLIDNLTIIDNHEVIPASELSQAVDRQQIRIYLHHREINSQQGRVILDRSSGVITTEIINEAVD